MKEYSVINFILKGTAYVIVYEILMWLLGMNKEKQQEILNPVRKVFNKVK